MKIKKVISTALTLTIVTSACYYAAPVAADEFDGNESKYMRYVLGVDYLLKKNGNDIKKLENIDLTNEEVLAMIKKEIRN